MLIAVWSPKGGVGTSVVAVTMAAVLARRNDDVQLVDLGGDAPAICGARVVDDVGIGEWLTASASTPAAAIGAITQNIDERFVLVPRGDARLELAKAGRGRALVEAMQTAGGICVVDAATAESDAANAIVALADLALVVVRPCYLTLQRFARRLDLMQRSAGLVLVDEPGRSLGAGDFATVAGRRILAQIPQLPEIARSVDAGILLRRRPERLFTPVERMCRQLGLRTSDISAA